MALACNKYDYLIRALLHCRRGVGELLLYWLNLYREEELKGAMTLKGS
jgi:hypothetical protein